MRPLPTTDYRLLTTDYLLREKRPHPDGDESSTVDEAQRARRGEALELRADDHADRGGEGECAARAGENNPAAHFHLPGEQHRGQLRLVAHLRNEYCSEDSEENTPHAHIAAPT